MVCNAFGDACTVGDRVAWAVVASCGDCAHCRRDLPQKCGAERVDAAKQHPRVGRGGARPAWGNSGLNSESFKSPPVPAQKAEPAHGIRAGIAVFHAKFGEGTVMTLEGSGGDARAQINFPRHGVKWLALSVAKLTPVP